MIHTDHGLHQVDVMLSRLTFEGGDPAARSRTATLLRLLPPCRVLVR